MASSRLPPRVGVSGVDWGRYFLQAWDAYATERGTKPDFLIPAIVRSMEGTIKLGGSAMSYHQFRTMLAAFLAQPPLNIPVDEAKKLSGHSARRTHPTVAGIRRCEPNETAALGNWQGTRINPTTDMPTRYQGARDLTQLGVKMESIAACKWAMRRAGAGSQLDWPEVARILALDDTPDFRQSVARALREMDNPTGSEQTADIFRLPEELEQTPERARPALSQEKPAQAISSEGSSSSDSDSSSSSSTTACPSPPTARVVQLRTIVGKRSLVAHGVRGTVHIVDANAPEKTACGHTISHWAAHLDVSVPELVRDSWSLCDRGECFRGATMSAEARAAGRRRSGRPA